MAFLFPTTYPPNFLAKLTVHLLRLVRWKANQFLCERIFVYSSERSLKLITRPTDNEPKLINIIVLLYAINLLVTYTPHDSNTYYINYVNLMNFNDWMNETCLALYFSVTDGGCDKVCRSLGPAQHAPSVSVTCKEVITHMGHFLPCGWWPKSPYKGASENVEQNRCFTCWHQNS